MVSLEEEHQQIINEIYAAVKAIIMKHGQKTWHGTDDPKGVLVVFDYKKPHQTMTFLGHIDSSHAIYGIIKAEFESSMQRKQEMPDIAA